METIGTFGRSHVAAGAAIAFAALLAWPLPAQIARVEPSPEEAASMKAIAGASLSELWVDRDPSKLDLMNGAGGGKHAPPGRFLFVKQDMNGTSAKFDITDAEGGKWKAKLGEEAQPEVAVSRLMWAAGYFVDEDYYAPEIQVAGIPKLKRAGSAVATDGTVHDVRLERRVEGQKKAEQWSWFRNPFVGTREFNGLKVMMALVNNWDLKEVNNTIYTGKNGERRYVVADIGATFGRTGNPLTRSKNNWDDYRKSKFIEKVNGDKVDFVVNSRPFLATAVDVPNYVTRTKMQGIVKNIPRADAKWIGQILGRLSRTQIEDCFRAAAYSAEDVAGYADVIQARIAELNEL